MTMQLAKTANIIDEGEIRVGNRYYMKSQGLYEVVSMPTPLKKEIRLFKVNGRHQFCVGPDMFKYMLDQKQAIPASKGITLQELNKDAVGLPAQDFYEFEHRVKIVKALCTLPTGMPKSVSKDEIQLVTKKHNEGAESRNLMPCKPPSYSCARKWVRLYEKRHHFHDLAVRNHRKSTRKKRLAEDAEQIMAETIKDFYAHWLQPTAEPVWCEYVRRYSEAHPELTNTELKVAMGSKSTFYRRLQRSDHVSIKERRLGQSHFRKQMKWGGPTEIPNYIGGLVEIDSTPVDVFVKHDDERFTYKPFLTEFIDVATRCVVAWHFSIAPPSGSKTALTLQKCVTRDNYPYRVIPKRFVGDHGAEFANETFLRQCAVLGIDPEFANPDHPDGKPYIESRFRTANITVFHQVAGSTKGKAPKDRPNRPENEAIYTLDTLEERYVASLDVYHHTVHSGLDGMTPHQKWLQLMADPVRAPRTLDPDDAVLIGYSIEHQALKNGRVRLHSLEWYSPSVAKLEADLNASGRKAEVRLNPFDLSKVYLCDPQDEKKNQYTAYATKPKYQNGLSLEDHNFIRKDKIEWRKIHNDDILLSLRKAEYYRILRNDVEDGVLSDLRNSKQTRTGISTVRKAKAQAAEKAAKPKPAKPVRQTVEDRLREIGDLSDYLG